MKKRYSLKTLLLAVLIVCVVTALVSMAITKAISSNDNTAPEQTQTENNAEDMPLNESENEVPCTLDAKLCPDGTGVGRSGPDCEFQPCPGDTDAKQAE